MGDSNIEFKRYPINNRYLVFSNGKIVDSASDEELVVHIDSNGYGRICRKNIAINKKIKTQNQEALHRIVCYTFHGPPPDDRTEVDHINGIREDNRADNLRWVNHPENLKNKANGGCISYLTDVQRKKMREYSKKHYLEHIDRERNRRRSYRKKNHKQILEKQRKYRDENREKYNAECREYYKKKREKLELEKA